MKVSDAPPIEPDDLIVDRSSPGVLLLTLNRPSALNALTFALHGRVDQELSKAVADPEIRSVVITGAGRAFCAGNDILELAGWTADELALAEIDREEYFWRFAECDKPIIAALNGVAVGAGAIMATSADIRVGCEDTSFRYTDAAHGAVHNTWNLPHIVGLAKAKEFLFTAKVVGADEAFAAGLLNTKVARADLLTEAMAIASSIAQNSTTVPIIKQSLHANIGMSLEHQYRRECRVLREMQKGTNPVPGVFADFLAKRKRD